MATEQKNAEAHCSNESRTWPVSLLGCLQDTSHTSQLAWPWLMLKACLCPASVLGANETLFQGEEPADVCCLQPYSFCGPTCRGLNTQLCGLGNEGLKLCAQTCLLQAACSCLCLGLPYVAWLSALQRQRVMAKHGVAVTDEDAWATACYPCSLLQMHALLQQQQQYNQHPHHSPRHPQQHHQAQSAPLRAPKLQHMTACASEAPSQASSYAGPLTSAMTSSKVMRAVRDQATRSDSAAPPGSHGAGSNRLGPRDSLDSTGSSMASETGVVNSPMVEKQQQRPEFQDSGPDSSRSNSRGDISARHSNRRTSARNSSEGAGSKQQQQPPSSGGTSHLRPPPPAAQQQLGPLMSARSHSSNGGAVFSTQHSMQPPRPGPARHCRAASLGSDIAASAAADAASTAASARCSDSDMVGPASQGQTPEPVSSSKRKLPGRAALPSQSCHLPNGFHSSAEMGLQGGPPPSTPPQASSTSAAAAGGTPWLSNSVEPGTLQAQQQGAIAVCTPPPHMHSSCSKASIGGSCSRLVTFSQEDVPLSAFKPNPGKANRRSSTGTCGGVSSSAASAGALGWGGYGSKAGSLAGSMQQQGHGHAEGSSQLGSCGNGGGGGGLSVEGVQPPAQQQHGGPAGGGGGALHAAPAGLALLVASNAAEAAEARGGWQQQVDPQYATIQSDICNYASWLEEPAPGHSTSANQQQQQQLLDAGSQLQQQEQQQQQVPQQERSEGDMCNYEEPISPPACSPKQAVSPATLSATKASSSPDTAAAETGDAAGVSAAAAAAAAAVGGRPTVLAAAWAYMSDMCNLGGSFDATSSTIGRSGLAAAVLSRFAADSSQQQQQEGGTLEGSQGRPSSGSVSGRPSSSSSNGRKQQLAPGAAAAAAAGSWPDTAPSPPHATLVAGSAADSTPATAAGSGAVAAASATAAANASGRGPAAACVSAAQGDGCSRALAAAPPAGIASKLRLPEPAVAAAADAGSSGGQGADEEEEVSSPPRRKRRGAAGGAYPSDSGVERFSSAQPEDQAARRGLSSRSISNDGAGITTTSGDSGSGRDEAAVAAAVAAVPSAVEGLDPQLLAAVTGTTSREQLTASQEELAAKLARLAFTNPASARQLAGAPPQQQQRQEQRRTPHEGGAVAVGSGGDRQQQHEQQARQQFEPFYPTVMSDMCNLADPDGEEAEELLERQGSQTNVRATGRAAAGSLQQHQQWQATAAAAGSMRGPMRPPAAAAAAGPMAYKPQLPGRPIRQQAQQQQFVGAASRLGRSAMGGAGPPSSNSSTAAAAAAAGVGDTAGPLRAALLLRGMRAAPGGPKQLPTGVNGSPANAGAAGILSRRMASPGDVAGDAGSAGAAACGSGGGAGGVLSMHGPHGEESLVSFDSYYVDCDLRQPGDAAAMDAANMITNNPLYTFTASEGGGTADSTRFSPGLKQQLRDASDAAAESGGSPGRGSPPYLVQQQQQWHDPGVVRGGKVGMGPAAAGGGGPAGSYEGRIASSSEHDDGVRQYDNSRSSSPALQTAADGAVFAAAASSMGSLQGSAGARSKRQHRDVDASGRDAAY